MRGWGAVLLSAGVAIAACTAAGAFECSDNADCDGDGVCQAVGFCSFPDPGCESGQRYGDHAGSLSNMCVPPDTAGTGTGSASEADDAVGVTGGESQGGDSETLALGSSSGGGSSTLDADGSDSMTVADTSGSGQVVFEDAQFAGGFAEGMAQGTWWNGAAMSLEDAEVLGTFESRVFDAGAVATWSTLSWTPDAPFAKPLPGQEGTDAGYATGLVDMADNIVLLRMDDADDLGPGSQFPDDSGHANDATLIADAPNVGAVPGVVNEAFADTMDSYLAIQSTDDFDFGTDDFTWALWFRSSSPCVGDVSAFNQAYLGIEDMGADRAHLWMGCVRPSSSVCGNDLGQGYAGGTFRAVHSVDGGGICGTSQIIDGNWHHMVITKTDHPDAVLRLYVDGVNEAVAVATFAAPIEFNDAPDLAVGAFQDGSPQAEADLDEIAIWRRALSEEEIAALYRRGAGRIAVQVRGCDEPSCEGVPWIGPDNLLGWYADATTEDGPVGPLALEGVAPSRYLQYRFTMERLTPSLESPQLGSVTVLGSL